LIGRLQSARASWLAGGGSQRGGTTMGGRYCLGGWHGSEARGEDKPMGLFSAAGNGQSEPGPAPDAGKRGGRPGPPTR